MSSSSPIPGSSSSLPPAKTPSSENKKCRFQVFHSVWDTSIESTSLRVLYAIGTITFHLLTLGIPLLIHHVLRHNFCSCYGKMPVEERHSPIFPSPDIPKKIKKSPASDIFFPPEEKTPPPPTSPPTYRPLDEYKKDPYTPDTSPKTSPEQIDEEAPPVPSHRKPTPPIVPPRTISVLPAEVELPPPPLPDKDYLPPSPRVPTPPPPVVVPPSVVTPPPASPEILQSAHPIEALLTTQLARDFVHKQASLTPTEFYDDIHHMLTLNQQKKAPLNSYQMFLQMDVFGNAVPTLNMNFGVSYPYPVSHLTRPGGELSRFTYPILQGQELIGDQNIQATLVKRQVKILNKDFIICQVSGDGYCFFRSFATAWLFSMSQKVASGDADAFIKGAQLILDKQEVNQSSKELETLSQKAASLILEAGTLSGPHAIMDLILIEPKKLRPLLHYLKKMTSVIALSDVSPDAVLAELLGQDEETLSPIWGQIQANPICSPLLIRAFNTVPIAPDLDNNVQLQDFASQVSQMPPIWQSSTAMNEFLTQLIYVADEQASSDEVLFNLFKEVTRATQHSPLAKKAFKTFSNDWPNILSTNATPLENRSPNLLAFFLQGHIQLLSTGNQKLLAQRFLTICNDKCLKPAIRSMQVNTVDQNFASARAAYQLHAPHLAKYQALKDIKSEIEQLPAPWLRLPVIGRFFHAHTHNLDLSTQDLLKAGLITSEQEKFYHETPQAILTHPDLPQVRSLFENFLQQNSLIKRFTKTMQFISFIENTGLHNAHPLIKNWCVLAANIQILTAKMSMDLLTSTHPDVNNCLGILQQLYPFNVVTVGKKAITQLQPQQQKLKLFNIILQRLEGTFSNPILQQTFEHYQKQINIELQKPENLCDIDIYRNAKEFLESQPQHSDTVNAFFNVHSSPVLKHLNPTDTHPTPFIPYPQQLLMLLKAHPEILEEHSAQTPNPLSLFVEHYSPIHTEIVSNLEWEQQTTQQIIIAMKNCDLDFTAMRNSLIKIPSMRELLQSFFNNNPQLLPNIQEIMTQALRGPGQAETPHVQAMASNFCPFSLCQAMWSNDSVNLTPSQLTQLRLSQGGFIGGDFVSVNPNGGIHILRADNHYTALIPLPKMP